MAVSEEVVELSERHLLGSLIEFVVDQIKAQPVAWAVLPEVEQRLVIERASRMCKQAVREAVNIVASKAMASAQAEIKSVDFRDGGIVVKCAVAKSQAARHELADAIGDMVVITLPAWAQIEDDAGKPSAESDQRELPGVGDPYEGVPKGDGEGGGDGDEK